MTAKAKNGKKFTGTYTINRFTQSGGKVLRRRRPEGQAQGPQRSSAPGSASRSRSPVTQTGCLAAAPNPTAGACQILDLVLQPDRPQPARAASWPTSRHRGFCFEAVPGANALLGNLLCAITGILDPRPRRGRAARQLAQVLNALLALVAPHRVNPQAAVPLRSSGPGRAAIFDELREASSPASSPPGASTSATTSARSRSTSPGRTAATRRSTASSTCTRRRSPTTRPSCASASTTRRRSCSPPGSTPSAASSSARATSTSTPSCAGC